MRSMDESARVKLRDWLEAQREADGWQGWSIERVTTSAAGRRTCAAVESIAAEDAGDDDDDTIERVLALADDGHRYQIRRRQEGGGGPTRSVRLRPESRGSERAAADGGSAQATGLARVAVAGMEQAAGIVPLLMATFEGISSMQAQQHSLVMGMMREHHAAAIERVEELSAMRLELELSRASTTDKLVEALLPVLAQIAPVVVARLAPLPGGS